MKIRKNDNVIVIAGKDKNKSGLVEHVFPSVRRAIVKGVNLAKKHVKPSKKNPHGGIIDINLKIDMSNLMLVCPSCSKPTRVGFQVSEKGKIRICRRCGQSVESRGNS